MRQKKMMNSKDSFTEKGKKKIKHAVFSRIYIIVILLLLETALFVWLGTRMKEYFLYSYGLIVLLTFLTYLVIVNQRGNPSYKLAWLLPIIVVPVLGIFFYIFCEYQRIPALVNRMQKNRLMKLSAYMEQDEAVFEKLKEISPESANLSAYLYRDMKFPVYSNTEVEYYPCGEEFFPHYLEELKKAEKFIFMEYFSFENGMMWNTILEILKEKVHQGVEVRFMYDGTCSFNHPFNYAKTLEKSGIKCRVFNQIRPILMTIQNNRDHRKITVIDGKVAFTGGINLEDAYINAEVRFGYWKDSVIRLKGDAVNSFTSMFLQMWGINSKSADIEENCYFSMRSGKTEPAEGFVIPYCDTPLDSDNTGESVYLDLLYNAKKYVHIMTPYLILDHELLTALSYAAKRGVDVKIMMPGIPDKSYAFAVAKTFYPELLQAGVKIYQFQPGFLHAKSFVADGERAVVGTINLDFRSLYLHFECAAFFCNMEAVESVEKDFQKTLLQCMEITPEICKKEKITTKLYGRMLRLVAPLM